MTSEGQWHEVMQEIGHGSLSPAPQNNMPVVGQEAPSKIGVIELEFVHNEKKST